MATYLRPAFGSAGIRFEEVQSIFAPGQTIRYPKPDYPAKPVENFRLAAGRRTPYWLPNSTLDFQTLYSTDCLAGFVAPPWGAKEPLVYKDEFGCQWKYVVSAGGGMLDPDGIPVVADVTKWEKSVKFPALRLKDSDFMEKTYDPGKVLHINVFQGLTERLVALMGGYTEAMLALIEEPEACADFFSAFADWEIAQIDKICEKYPADMITYHDDWGTERDTFFSEQMMETLVLEPTRRIVRHAKSKGAAFELHCCGKIGRFLKYMIDVGVDFLQIQGRANDIPALKRDFGDRIGFCVFNEKLLNPNVTADEAVAAARSTVEKYGKSGGAYAGALTSQPEAAWAFIFELYAYSREFYDRERGE